MQNKYDLSRHFGEQLVRRGLTLPDALNTVEKPKRVEPYPSMPQHGGSAWRVFGRDVDDEQDIAVGAETYISSDGQRMIFCTLFADEVSR